MERQRPSAGPAARSQPPAGIDGRSAWGTAEFANAARVLGVEARRRGLVAPGFRSPPRLVGVDRSIRRHPHGASVSVRVRGRPLVAVAADMIEGVVAANRLTPPQSDRLRADLWSALGFQADAPANRRVA